MRRELGRLLDQQWWCWGRDVARREGNLLLQLGMCRYRPTVKSRDGTLYTALTPEGATIHLWGFGAYLVDESLGGLYLGRGGFAPRLSERPDALGLHTSDALLAISRPVDPCERGRARPLVEAFARWVAHYEHWIAENQGVAYRRTCLEAWDKKPACEARDMALSWETVARKARRLLGEPESAPWRPWDGLLHQLRSRIRQVSWNQ